MATPVTAKHIANANSSFFIEASFIRIDLAVFPPVWPLDERLQFTIHDTPSRNAQAGRKRVIAEMDGRVKRIVPTRNGSANFIAADIESQRGPLNDIPTDVVVPSKRSATFENHNSNPSAGDEIITSV